MKISKLFHWLYASVMMLPLVVAPIYAIFMHRHNVTNYEVNTGGYEVTEKYTTNEVNDYDDIVINNIYHCDYFAFDSGDEASFIIHVYSFSSCTFDVNGGSFLGSSYNSSTDNYIEFAFGSYSKDGNYEDVTCKRTNMMYYDFYTSSYYYFELSDFDFIVIDGLDEFIYSVEAYSSSVTASTFNALDYQYNEGLIYNDIDIGSQFVYSIYLPLNKYFNVTNFLGLNTLYGWINTNVFNGGAPLGFNIFYMLLSYWLLVSIFWLVFDVVMYVPNLAHRWLDKGSLQ